MSNPVGRISLHFIASGTSMDATMEAHIKSFELVGNHNAPEFCSPHFNGSGHETDCSPSSVEPNDSPSKKSFADPVIATEKEDGVNCAAQVGNVPVTDAEIRIRSLTTKDLRELTMFARFRLLRVALPRAEAEDVVQDSISAVMLGIRTEAHGRKPRPADLLGRDAFTNYLKGVISSAVDAKRRHSYRHQLVALQDETLTLEAAFAKELALRDFSQHFFQRLEEKIADDLRPILRDWASNWHDCYSIPIGDRHRRIRQRLRRLAAETFIELTSRE